jgi:hypothetical protein
MFSFPLFASKFSFFLPVVSFVVSALCLYLVLRRFLSRFIESVCCIKNRFLSVCLLAVCLPVNLYVLLPSWLSVCLPDFLAICLSICSANLFTVLCLSTMLFVYRPICLSFNPFLFIKGLSCPNNVQTTLNQNCLKLSIPGFPISCGDIGF